eukprot:3240991-Rhodomonas_salina.2
MRLGWDCSVVIFADVDSRHAVVKETWLSHACVCGVSVRWLQPEFLTVSKSKEEYDEYGPGALSLRAPYAMPGTDLSCVGARHHAAQPGFRCHLSGRSRCSVLERGSA